MSAPVESVLAALRGAGCSPKPKGDGYSVRCPAHDDRTPSLSIGEGEDGRALLTCHAGCCLGDVLSALGLIAGLAVHAGDVQDRSWRWPRSLVASHAIEEPVWADGGYAGELVDNVKRWYGRTIEIVKRSDAGKFVVLPKR